MAVSWNFMPSFVDVFEAHHTPDRAQHDPYLVGIVAVADQFLISQSEAEPQTVTESSEAPESHGGEIIPPEYLAKYLPLLAESERHALLETLQTEYIHLLPLVQIGIAAATGNQTEN
jgi:hypothetical protein